MTEDANRQTNSNDNIPSAPLGRQLLVVGLVVIVLVMGILYAKSRAKEEPGEAKAGGDLNPNQVLVSKAAALAVELKTAKVTLESGKHLIHTNGVVHYAPNSIINVSPRLTGTVRNVFVSVGDRVQKGQLLAQMVSSDAANAVATAKDADEQLKLTSTALDTARKQLILGTPEVTSAEAALIQARENTSYTKRMLALSREQSDIGGFTDKPLTDALSAAKQAETQLSQDNKDLALAQSQYQRTSKLFGYGVAAKADVETAENVVGKAQDAVNNDREQARIADLTVQRERKAFQTRLYSNQNVRQAESNYQQAVIQERSAATALAIAKAALLHDVKQAEHDYKAAMSDSHAAHTVLSTYDNPSSEGLVNIVCPAPGVITARNINPGQIVDQTGETPWQMFSIVNSATVYLDAQIYEKDMMGLKVGEHVTGSSDVLPSNYTATGVVSYVSPGLDATTHALSVRADLDNRRGLLKDGMYLSASVNVGPVSPFPDIPIVPLTAVVHDGNDDYVFLAKGDGKYDRRQVTLGEQRGESEVEIAKGLSGDETIVTHGALFLGTGGTAQD